MIDREYYINLITSEHRDKPQLIAWLDSLLSIIETSGLLSDTMYLAFDLDQAQGMQLDVIGDLVGQSRTINFQPFLGLSPVLEDPDYRSLLRSRIAKNQWKGTIGELKTIWETIFPNGQIILQDKQNMAMDIIWISGSFSLIMGELIRAGYICPKPEGVQINYFFGGTPFFGWDLQNTLIAGFDTGYWSNPYAILPIFGFDLQTADIAGFDTGNLSN